MKKLITVLILLFPISLFASEYTIGLEFLLGFGQSSSNSGVNSKYCKNRSWNSLKGFGVYISKEDVELHASRYSHDSDTEACDRSNWAFGIGPKFSTKDSGEQKDLYAEWSPGVVFRLNETWRDHGKFSLFNRLRIGTKIYDKDEYQLSLESSWLKYGGFFEKNHGEDFLTFGLSVNELSNISTHNANTSNNNSNNDSSSTYTNNNNNTSSTNNDSNTQDTTGSTTELVNNNNNNNTTIINTYNNTTTVNEENTTSNTVTNNNNNSTEENNNNNTPSKRPGGHNNGWGDGSAGKGRNK